MNYTDLTVGRLFLLDGEPYEVLTAEFHRMQMRKAIMRTTIKNLITGNQVQKTFTASDTFDPAPVDEVEASYLYKEDDVYFFMDKNTFEQYQINESVLGDKINFLIEEITIKMMLFNEAPIQITLPKKVNLKVTDAPPALKGDSVSNTFKTVTLETGLQVSVPLFIKEGEVLTINTETSEYVERAKI